MIVRILGEGQWDVADSDLDRLNELDGQVESAVESGDETTFRSSLAALLDAVRGAGRPLPDESLEDSDLILPPSDATLEEVRELLADDGLIPG
jgi:PspA-Associated protein